MCERVSTSDTTNLYYVRLPPWALSENFVAFMLSYVHSEAITGNLFQYWPCALVCTVPLAGARSGSELSLSSVGALTLAAGASRLDRPRVLLLRAEFS